MAVIIRGQNIILDIGGLKISNEVGYSSPSFQEIKLK